MTSPDTTLDTDTSTPSTDTPTTTQDTNKSLPSIDEVLGEDSDAPNTTQPDKELSGKSDNDESTGQTTDPESPDSFIVSDNDRTTLKTAGLTDEQINQLAETDTGQTALSRMLDRPTDAPRDRSDDWAKLFYSDTGDKPDADRASPQPVAESKPTFDQKEVVKELADTAGWDNATAEAVLSAATKLFDSRVPKSSAPSGTSTQTATGDALTGDLLRREADLYFREVKSDMFGVNTTRLTNKQFEQRNETIQTAAQIMIGSAQLGRPVPTFFDALQKASRLVLGAAPTPSTARAKTPTQKSKSGVVIKGSSSSQRSDGKPNQPDMRHIGSLLDEILMDDES